MLVRLIASLALGTLLIAAGLISVARAESGALSPLTIETGAGVHAIEVEVARTAQERGIGLMHRTALAPDRGMLFDYGMTRQATMWMKNTLISLDMFFAGSTGLIVTIAERTTPLSEKRISSGQPVRFVLEMIGGSAQRLGIAPGDRLRHALIEKP